MQMQKFSDFIANYRGGIFDDILSKELVSVTEAVQNVSRKGELHISIALKPAGAYKMDIVATYKSKPPVNNNIDGMMFVDDDKQLVADDPHQPDLPLSLAKIDTKKTLKVI